MEPRTKLIPKKCWEGVDVWVGGVDVGGLDVGMGGVDVGVGGVDDTG